jgi:hypothetical protein
MGFGSAYGYTIMPVTRTTQATRPYDTIARARPPAR